MEDPHIAFYPVHEALLTCYRSSTLPEDLMQHKPDFHVVQQDWQHQKNTGVHHCIHQTVSVMKEKSYHLMLEGTCEGDQAMRE